MLLPPGTTPPHSPREAEVLVVVVEAGGLKSLDAGDGVRSGLMNRSLIQP